MDTKTLSFIAIAVSMIFGVGFTIVSDSARPMYAVIGGVIVALCWIAVGMFGRGGGSRDRDQYRGRD